MSDLHRRHGPPGSALGTGLQVRHPTRVVPLGAWTRVCLGTWTPDFAFTT